MEKVRISTLGLAEFPSASPEFYVNTLADHLKTSHLHISKPHKHSFYATMLFTRGTGIHEIDFNSYPVAAGSVFLMAPGQTHNWQLSDNCDGYIFFHSQEFYETHYLNEMLRQYPFFSLLQNRSALIIDGQKFVEVAAMFDKVLSENKSELPQKKQMLLSLITQIYIELNRFGAPKTTESSTEPNSYHQKFKQFEELLEVEFIRVRSVQAYADKMSMSAKHLNRICKSVLNKSTSELIADRIVLEAKRLLIYKRNNYSEIAAELGFEDYAHFSKMFKSKTGMSPSAFAKPYY